MPVPVRSIKEGVIHYIENLPSTTLNLDDEFGSLIYNKRNGGGNVHFIDDQRKRKLVREHIIGIARNEDIPDESYEDFFHAIHGAVRKFKSSLAHKELPDRPARPFEHGENVIDYIRAEDGLGPWVAANALSRPLILKLAPGAYYALANYLRRNELPEDLNIPKKSEALETEEITPESVKAARRLLSRVERQKRSGREMS